MTVYVHRARAIGNRLADHIATLPDHDQMRMAAILETTFAPVLDGETPLDVACFEYTHARLCAQVRPSLLEAEELVRTATHEAGHALVAWRLDIDFACVSLAPHPAENSTGFVLLSSPVPTSLAEGDAGRLDVERYICLTLAGPLAEGLTSRFPSEASIASHNSDAERQTLRLRPAPSREESRSLVDFCRARAARILRADWPAVTALADALMDHRLILAPDAIRVMQDALGESLPALSHVA